MTDQQQHDIYGNVVEDARFDVEGNRIDRSIEEYPYNHSEFVTWSKYGRKARSDGSAYTDRLKQQDYDKYNQLSEKHFGNAGDYWGGRSPELVEAFLRDFTGDRTLELIRITRSCNQSSGFPLWAFEWKI